MYSITVLMSTFNGAQFLREQIDSILGQEGVKVNLLVRDDGSSDNTIQILQEYSKKKQLKWYTGSNLGAAYSFMNLLKKAPKDEYYAFSDQDDVWDSNKLLVAINFLKDYDKEKIVLYSCNSRVVDRDLNIIGDTTDSIPVITYIDSLIHNNCQGCTMVYGFALCELLKQYEGLNLLMHDDLTIKVCLAVGGMVYKDTNCYMSYRQHTDNVIGVQESIRHSIKRRCNSLLHQSCERSRELKDIYINYREFIPEENLGKICKIAFYKERLFGKVGVIFDKSLRATDKKTTRHFLIGVLLGFF